MLTTHLQTQAELKRNLHSEAKINEQKMKELSPKDALDTPQRGGSARSPIPAEHNQLFPEDHSGKWNNFPTPALLNVTRGGSLRKVLPLLHLLQG